MLGRDDESGDAHLFTARLAEAAQQAGVTLRYDCDIERVMVDGKRVSSLHLVDGSQPDPADAYRTVRAELAGYGAGLSEKPEIVALNKADAMTPQAKASRGPAPRPARSAMAMVDIPRRGSRRARARMAAASMASPRPRPGRAAPRPHRQARSPRRCDGCCGTPV